MRIGVDYYPEHWPPERWETDAALMEKAGFNVVRMGEFAWVFFEPQEGQMEFSWLDEALAVLGRHGISAILGTPTAVMPSWVARSHPEALAVDKTGRRSTWGVRKNNCFAAETYRRLSVDITRAMARHYSTVPNVIGWQTDNEFGGPVCYCDTCKAAFRDWLRDRYTTLDALNRAWGTHFWGHRYGAWEEISLPDDVGSHNPGHCLDHHRFHSWLTTRFQADQVHVLRSECPGHFITHNFMGLYSELDYWELAKDLDFVSWDNYPVWGAPEIHEDAAAAADLMRGLKKKNFWIMEQTAGPCGWGVMGRNPRPGEIRQIAFQQVARGADAILWFRWRTCTAGREQYWHGLLGHDGKPRRRYQETARVAAELHRLAPDLEGTSVRSPVAMIYDYESVWAFRIQPAYAGEGGASSDGSANYQNAIRRWHRALFRAGVGVEMIRPGDDLSAFKVIFAPHLYILRDETAEQLAAFVRSGGVLVTDCRTAVKDESSLCRDRTLPGLLSEVLGISIEEYEALAADMRYTVAGTAGFPGSYTAGYFTDWVIPGGAEVLARFGEWHMKEYAGLTRNRCGLGWGYHVATIVREPVFYESLVAEVLDRAGVRLPARPPSGVERSVREGAGKKLVFFVNHTEEERTIEVPAGVDELIGGKKTAAVMTLKPYDVAVIRL